MKIGICAIASPLEIPYLREWFDHHHAMGVEKFYLTLNDWSVSDMVEFNRLFCKEQNDKTIEVLRMDGPRMQYPSFNRMTELSWDSDIDWVAFIDIDEFLKIRPNQDGTTRTLEQVLSDFSDIPSLALRWRLFSSGGQEHVPIIDGKPNYSVTRFTKCCPCLEELMKQFVNYRYLKENGIHYPSWHDPHFSSLMSHDQRRRYIWGSVDRYTRELPDELELNHYWSKSKDECRIRRDYRRVNDAQVFPWQKDYEDNLKRCTIDEAELTFSKQVVK